MDWVSHSWSDNKKAKARQQEAGEISQKSQDLNQHWEDMDDLTPWALDEISRLKHRLEASSDDLDSIKPTLSARLSKLLIRPTRIGLILLLGSAALITVQYGRWPLATETVSYTTAPGEQRKVLLPDGSLLHLNTASSVLLDYQTNTRALRFKKGEALIEVVENPSRPFVLRAFENELFTLGARFNLRIKNSRVTLVVAEGQVVVLPSQLKAEEYLLAGRESDLSNEPLLVTEGFQLHIDADGSMAAPQAVDALSVISWDRGMLRFHEMPLRQAAQEVSRYMLTNIQVASAVQDQLVSGEIPIRDQETMLRHLCGLTGLESVQRSADVVLLYNPSVQSSK
jgi:transmembrane sensor